jgi:flagellar hook assembly protein FlgD
LDEYAIPGDYTLYQNYPNPFNPTTTIRYYLSKATQVQLKIYNLLGKEIKTLVHQYQPAGENSIPGDGKNSTGQSVGSGIYIYILKTENYVGFKQLLLLK